MVQIGIGNSHGPLHITGPLINSLAFFSTKLRQDCHHRNRHGCWSVLIEVGLMYLNWAAKVVRR